MKQHICICTATGSVGLSYSQGLNFPAVHGCFARQIDLIKEISLHRQLLPNDISPIGQGLVPALICLLHESEANPDNT